MFSLPAILRAAGILPPQQRAAREYREVGHVIAKGGGQVRRRVPLLREVTPRGRIYPGGSVPGGLRRKMAKG